MALEQIDEETGKIVRILITTATARSTKGSDLTNSSDNHGVDVKILAIFAGKPVAVPYRGKAIRTSIYKQPVEGPIMVRRLNIDGDEQADLSVHGGIDKAVYCYPAEHYEAWRRELGRDMAYGAFGENLTVAGLDEAMLHAGDVLTVGGVVLQVSQPRFPCFKLGIKFGDQGFLKRFLESGRSGFYCRVLQEGTIEALQAISMTEQDSVRPTIAEMVEAYRKSS